VKNPLGLYLFLAVLGAGWGLNSVLAKIAVSGGYAPFGLIFWQLVITSLILGVICWMRGSWPKLGWSQLRMALFVALIGTIVPNAASYRAAIDLPAGLLALLLSLVPICAFPLALVMGNEQFSGRKLLGLSLGALAVALLVLPDEALPDAAMLALLPLAVIAPICYGLEGNGVAKWGTGGLSPVELLFLASLLGAAIVLPLAIVTGQWISPAPPYALPDLALVASAMIHALVYTGYVWLVGRAGAVFASQVAYLVTGFGIFWAMAILGESYASSFWGAMALMLLGVFFVQPRKQIPLVAAAPLRHTKGE
jgi:drug/metabolite transporter (DMT)-like permease